MKPFICCASLLILCFLTGNETSFAQTGGGYDLSWSTIDGGGGTFSTGGEFRLGGTVGQPDAGVMGGGEYILQGGFWAIVGVGTPQQPMAPFDCDLVAGNNPSLNPRCDCFDMLVVIEDRKSGIPAVNSDFNGDTFENDLDLLYMALGWYRAPGP